MARAPDVGFCAPEGIKLGTGSQFLLYREVNCEGKYAVIRPPDEETAHEMLVAKFRWREGHADIWKFFVDGSDFSLLINGLAEPWRDAGITHVLGIESRGFLLGGAVAVSLNAGFQAVRKEGGLLPGPKLFARSELDYRSKSYELRMQDVLSPGDVVLLVDDWAELGSQATAARTLVESSGARFAGASLIVDQLEDEMRMKIGRVTSLAFATELGNPDA